MTVQGHGIGGYFVEMPRFVQDFPIATYRPEYAENEFLHFAFELGVPGVLLSAGIFVRSFLCADGLKLRLIVLPSRLTSESHTVDWYFARCDRAIRTFPLDHSLWKVPLDLLDIIPAGRIPAEVLDKVLSDARMRDPNILLASRLLR